MLFGNRSINYREKLSVYWETDQTCYFWNKVNLQSFRVCVHVGCTSASEYDNKALDTFSIIPCTQQQLRCFLWYTVTRDHNLKEIVNFSLHTLFANCMFGSYIHHSNISNSFFPSGGKYLWKVFKMVLGCRFYKKKFPEVWQFITRFSIISIVDKYVKALHSSCEHFHTLRMCL